MQCAAVLFALASVAEAFPAPSLSARFPGIVHRYAIKKLDIIQQSMCFQIFSNLKPRELSKFIQSLIADSIIAQQIVTHSYCKKLVMPAF